jgi:Pretoxin HINT domain
MSFTAGTKVLVASGAAVAISQLKPGEKVLATNTKTAKTQAETVTAVLVHHDTDLYDLKIRSGHTISVIDTTSNHLFWVPGAGGHGGRWVKAGALRCGSHLRSPNGVGAVALGGWVPRQHDGWMWDLTIQDDHDFYIDTTVAPVLVHNCGGLIGRARGAYTEAKRLANVSRAWFNNRALANSLGGVPPEPNATVGDLLDMVPGNPQRADKLAAGLGAV